MKVNSTSFIDNELDLSAKKNVTCYVRCSCGLLNNERTPDGHRHSYLFDGLGSIVGVTKGDGTKENSYDDDPYGNMLHQTEGVTNPWKFAGGFLDSSTSLYKFGTRYDDPALGRWTQQDPVGGSLGNPDSFNRYLYAGDDPVNEVDPSGKLGGSIIFAGWIPIGLAVNFSANDLKYFSGPYGTIATAAVGIFAGLLLSVFGLGLAGIGTAAIIAAIQEAAIICPTTGASIEWYYADPTNLYVVCI